MEDRKLPEYEMPKIITYTDEEMLEELGAAQTGYVKVLAFWQDLRDKQDVSSRIKKSISC